jgi:hypothetical protein
MLFLLRPPQFSPVKIPNFYLEGKRNFFMSALKYGAHASFFQNIYFGNN